MYIDQNQFTAVLEEGVEQDTARLFGLDLMKAGRGDVAALLVRRARIGLKTVVSFVNAHCVNVLASDRMYRRHLRDSDLCLPDGSGISLAAKLAGVKLGENLNGTDLFPLICERAARRGVALYLLGGGPGIAAAAGEAMQARYPDLRIAGTHNGYFSNDEGIVAEINASGADMVFVGMGVPRQEKWIAKHQFALTAPTLLGVGGLFDYYSGRIPRAPLAMRRIGCEWLWRLMQEPRRLLVRYTWGNAAFVTRAVLHGLAVRTGWKLRFSAKRLFDLIIATAALIALSPALAVVAAAIMLETPGGVFFRQTRIGAKGRPFRMWKFRSMVADAEQKRAGLVTQSDRDSVCFKMKNDPRVTRVGRFIRRWSIDEVPQLLNVVAGEMSLVGPRPLLPQEMTYWATNLQRRLEGLPGVTCTWQIGGRAEIPFEQQLKMDVAYLDDASMATDIALLFRTVPAVISARGAY